MIVFTNLPIETFISISQTYPVKWDSIRVMNINSYDGTYPILQGILPVYGTLSDYALLNDTEPEFEYEYFRYLTEGPGFVPFSFIALNEYKEGNTLWIYQIDRSPSKDSIIESIMKLLQLRYGIVSNIVSDIEDILNINTDNTLSLMGLANIDADTVKLVSMGVITDVPEY